MADKTARTGSRRASGGSQQFGILLNRVASNQRFARNHQDDRDFKGRFRGRSCVSPRDTTFPSVCILFPAMLLPRAALPVLRHSSTTQGNASRSFISHPFCSLPVVWRRSKMAGCREGVGNSVIVSRVNLDECTGLSVVEISPMLLVF